MEDMVVGGQRRSDRKMSNDEQLAKVFRWRESIAGC